MLSVQFQAVMSPLQVWYSLLLWSLYCWDQGLPRSVQHNDSKHVGESRKCHPTMSQCEDRQKVKLAQLTAQGGNEYLATYIVCEISKIFVDCIEEYICTCSNHLNIDYVNDFNTAWQDYLHHCNLDNIIQRRPAYTAKDMTILDSTPLVFNDSLSCPGVLHCRNVSKSYRSRSSAESSKDDMKTVMCEGIRLSVVCMTDAFCSCGLTADPVAKVQVSSLKYHYQHFCQQEESRHNLCEDFLLACERRVLAHYRNLLHTTDYTFISCEILFIFRTFKVRIQCFEDFICTCPGKDTSNLDKNFHDYKRPYEEHCRLVPGHNPRLGDLRCQGVYKQLNTEGTVGGDTDVSRIFVTPDIVMYQSSVHDVGQLLKGKCPTSSSCSSLTSPEYQHGDSQCRHIKHQVLCQAEVLCRCTTDNQSFFWTALGSLLYLHNITCREGAKPSSTVWLTFASISLLTVLQKLQTGTN
ncbi:hypothetical protein Btru_058645 [Bulinus truncatus]|nr:hypothetical protein Btru_058645 [Bulinus truncatus]